VKLEIISTPHPTLSPVEAERVALPETVVLEAAAAQSAEIAVGFLQAGNRRAAREHLQRAIEQLNEAEIED
jgi:Tfp pilus assembly protein PilF